MKNYRMLDHTADIGFEVKGPTIEQLFENAGDALFEIMADPKVICRGATG